MPIRRMFLCLPLVLSVTLLAQIQSSKVTTTYFGANPTNGVLSTKSMMSPMPLNGPFFLNTESISTSMLLVNSAGANAGATVTLYSLNGARIGSRHVVLEPDSQTRFPIASLIPQGVANLTQGSVSVLQDANVGGMAIAAQFLLTQKTTSEPAFVDEELMMEEMEASNILRGTSDSADDVPLIAVNNLAEVPQHVTLECIHENGEVSPSTLTLAPHATSFTEGCSSRKITDLEVYIRDFGNRTKQPGTWGMELVGDGAAGTLAAIALVPHKREGYVIFSSALFSDPKTINSTSAIYSGVPFGTQTIMPDGVSTTNCTC